MRFSASIVFFFCSLALFSQNGCEYFKYINNAELESRYQNPEKSIANYDSAFSINIATPIDLNHALRESSKIKNFSKNIEYLHLLLKTGTDFTDEINSMDFADEFKATSLYSEFMKDFPSKLHKYQSTFDTVVINQLKLLAISDQKYRNEYHEKGDTSHYKLMRETDIANFYLLTDIVKKIGWPNYKKVGQKYTGIANIVLLHGSRYFSLESKEWLFFEEILKQEIYNGNFYPITLAQWIDQHLRLIEKKSQRYGSTADYNGILFPIDNFENIDVVRHTICCEPLSDYMKKKGLHFKTQ